MRRLSILVLSALLVSAPFAGQAAEAARSRIEARLLRAGFELVGEAKRKGDFVVLNAARDGVTWFLVIDARTGQIVGEKPVGLPAFAAD